LKTLLTIDLDYIAEPYIELYHKVISMESVQRNWDIILNDPALTKANFDVNISNIVYMFDVYHKALRYCDNVVFGLHHDAILYELEPFDQSIDLILNLDHHHDIWYPSSSVPDTQYGMVSDGMWLKFLSETIDIKKYIWIGNENSDTYKGEVPNFEFKDFNKKTFEFTEEDAKEVDFIYICLSPNYVPKFHWFYFVIMKNAYENYYGESAKIINDNYKTNPKRTNPDMALSYLEEE